MLFRRTFLSVKKQVFQDLINKLILCVQVTVPLEILCFFTNSRRYLEKILWIVYNKFSIQFFSACENIDWLQSNLLRNVHLPSFFLCSSSDPISQVSQNQRKLPFNCWILTFLLRAALLIESVPLSQDWCFGLKKAAYLRVKNENASSAFADANISLVSTLKTPILWIWLLSSRPNEGFKHDPFFQTLFEALSLQSSFLANHPSYSIFFVRFV